MNLKLCAIAATICGFHSINKHPRSIQSQPKSLGIAGQSVAKQIDMDSNSILANYGRVLVESNLK